MKNRFFWTWKSALRSLRIGWRAGLALIFALSVRADSSNITVDGSRLLMPFSQLMSSAAGQATLADNLATTLSIQNNATSAQQAQAIHDFEIDSHRGTSLVDGLGSSFQSTYFNAIYSNNTLIGPSSSHLYQVITLANNLTGNAALFAKTFFGNATTGGESISFPPNGQPDVYGSAYVPSGDLNPNPEGDPRPFQVFPFHPPDQLVTFSAPTFVIPEPGGSPPPVGPVATNVELNASLWNSGSFPSGHTTYAYTTSLLFGMMLPEAFQAMMLRASEFGYSRIVMGAHYPVDIMGGRTLATYLMAQWLNDPAHLDLLKMAGGDLRALLAQGGGVIDPNFSLAANRTEYAFRMNYGLSPVGPTNLTAVVPVGAEVLLVMRFPYLSAEQRREVLRTTEGPSGDALENLTPGFEGWERLNLFNAGGGYGSLEANTTVTMDASLGGLNAADTWNNDIGGNATLTKAGTGTLTLTGNNTFGGVQAIGGMLALTGNNNFTGVSSVGGGAGAGRLRITGNLVVGNMTASASGTLIVAAGSQLGAGGDIRVETGGVLNLFVSGNGQLHAGTSGNGSFINQGTANFVVGPGLPAGNYSPVAVGGVSGNISGAAPHVFGGVWDAANATVVVAPVIAVAVNSTTRTGTLNNVQAGGRRIEFDFSSIGGADATVAFDDTVGAIDLRSTELLVSVIHGYTVLGAYDFTSTLTGGNVVLSYEIGAGYDGTALRFWKLDSGGTDWERIDPALDDYAGTWSSFGVNDFGSYAVTVPEPKYSIILGAVAAVVALAVRRRNRG